MFHEKIVVFPIADPGFFAVMQSSVHWAWAERYTSTLGAVTLNYSPSDCFDTFPQPTAYSDLEGIAYEYDHARSALMAARQKGLTSTYNCFHDPQETFTGIAKLRELHVEMDRAVARAYDWDDLELEHGFHETRQGVRFTISEAARQEVLDRLLALNHERYAEEVRQGLHEKGARKRPRRPPKVEPAPAGHRVAQPDLGFDFQPTQPRAARR